MSVIVFGYHEIGCAALRALLEADAPVRALVTHRDDPGEELWFDRPAGLAAERGIPVHYAEDLGAAELRRLVAGLAPEFIFSFYFRRLLPESLLRLARRGALNLHGSLLPRYRGRCPVNWVIVNGEPETGLTLHHMVARADAGDVVAQRRVEIAPRETALTLHRKLVPAAYEMIRQTWPLLRDGTAPRAPQDESRATVFGGRRPEDGRIDWRWPAARVDCLVRGVTHPYPGAFTRMGERKLLIWAGRPEDGGAAGGPAGRVLEVSGAGARVACGQGSYVIESAQFEGGAEAPAAALGLEPGALLGSG